MPQVTCRCGQVLYVPEKGSDRVVCPSCSSRIRVRRAGGRGRATSDGFLRFHCQCGRRLKVRADQPPESGQCPDCGRVVPVPEPSAAGLSLPPNHPETPTEELSAADLIMLERWSRDHLARAQGASGGSSAVATPPQPASGSSTGKMEAGLRVCPRCGRPVHLGSDVCLECGARVPKR